jgi:GPH family glycoside/pentoside/hexuronide:cation symporter
MEQRLTLGTKVRYGLADLGIALITSAMQFFLLFYYTDVAGINPALAGTALLVGKLTWDALNDPLFGYWSDRTRSRFGRRRIWMLIGAVPLGIAASMFSVLGYILGAALTTLLAGIFQGTGLNLQQAWSATGAVFGAVAITTTLVTTLTIKERPELAGEPSKLPPLRAMLTCFRNRPFDILMIAQFLSSFSFTVLTALVPYFITYQLGMGDQVSFVLLVMLLVIGIFLLPAKKVSDKINKGPAYALGLFIASVAIMAGFFFPSGPTPLIYVIAAVAGLGFSAQWVFPWSMLPDVVEYDEKITGERREGVYYGLWAFLGKFTSALGVAVSGWSLDLFGYVPNVAQTARALFGIRVFFAIVPAAVILISLPFLIWYPITRKSHGELVKELAERKVAAGKPA